MQVYLPAIKGLVPPQIVEALGAFLDFCYLVRRSDFDEDTLDAIDASVANYHERREIFRDLRVRLDGFSIPRQHAMVHYRPNIEKFGAPGGVCSSITESRHITAIKKPWRRSSRYEALSQMLLTNQRLDKLSAARANFVERGMVPPNFTAVPDKIVEDADVEETDEQRVEGTVILARTRGGHHFWHPLAYVSLIGRTITNPCSCRSHQSPRISRPSCRLPSRPALFPKLPQLR